jgi:NAD(P)-dependent dehydrogenase (short-subunit alcohol dehydrogenase family)
MGFALLENRRPKMDSMHSKQIVLIAGGTGGLGRAVSLAFLKKRCEVVVTYQIAEEWEALQAAAGENKARLEGFKVDVTDDAAVRSLIASILNKYGQLDALVNTVGGYAGGVKLWELPPSVFEKMLALNLRAGFVLSQAVVPVMLKRRSGAIVNVAAKAAYDHGAGAAAYAASKAAALAMMDSLAADLKGTGVRVNSILPSIIDTQANRKAMPGSDFSTWPKPEDIATVILFLCSEDAKVIHGAGVPVYGNR